MPPITITINCETADEARDVLDTLTNRADAPTTPATPPAAEPAAKADTAAEITATDADGFPFDPDLHTAPDNFKADGRFRAKRGKSDEEKAARAAWKAAGGATTPPQTPPSLPGQAAPASGVPGLPGTKAEEETLPPVTLEEVFGKATELLDAGKITNEAITGIYKEVTGVEGDDVAGVFATNETARRALWDALVEYE